ncbi:MAG: cytochrome c-type biogenesis protein CcmH [Chloroflexi bacterium]|nr:MAG: cytochrome c-type biogenesis protein CcmH [Chloroflexota bacterium]
MSDVIPPEGATDEQVDAFIASLRAEARARVREMMAAGASEDEITEYIESLESAGSDAAEGTSSSAGGA